MRRHIRRERDEEKKRRQKRGKKEKKNEETILLSKAYLPKKARLPSKKSCLYID